MGEPTIKGALGRLFGTGLTLVLGGTLVLVVYFFVALQLGMVTGSFFIGILALAALAGRVWLGRHGMYVPARVALGAAVMFFAVAVVQARAPGLFHMGQTIGTHTNETADRVADLMQTPHVVPCIAPYFIGKDRHARYHHAPGEHPLRCYDWTGRDPSAPVQHPDDTTQLLLPDTPGIIALRMEQQKAATVSAVPMPPPVPAAPGPEMSERAETQETRWSPPAPPLRQ